MDVAAILQKRTIDNYKRLIKGKKLIIIDEAQAVPDIGKILKLMIDNIKGITIIGQLWEQYILSERIKYNSCKAYFPQYFFWRTYDGQEIDFIEINNKQKLAAFECKWKEEKVKIPGAFAKAYPEADFKVVNQESYLDFITDSYTDRIITTALQKKPGCCYLWFIV